MLLDAQHDVFPWGTLHPAWRLLDRTVEVEKMLWLCRLGVQQSAAFVELWYAVPLILCWNTEDGSYQHPKQ